MHGVLWMCGWLMVTAAVAAQTSPAAKSPSVSSLVRTARGVDEAAGLAALRELAALGEPARDDLKAVLRFWLDRDERTLRRASAAVVTKLASMQQQMDARREKAWAVIDKLDKSKIAEARTNYDVLMPMQAEISRAYAGLLPIAAALGRREELLDLWRSVASEEEHDARAATDSDLVSKAEAALGLTAAEAREITQHRGGKLEGEGVARALQHHAACRAIDAFNAGQTRLLNKQELANAMLVNTYREALGILPMEWDARVIQAARRHSREMKDLGFFSHESPTAENKTHTMRMKNAGHPNGAAENIAAGSGSGEATFWQWFESPGHHKNMVGRSYVAFGVGQWGDHWTQNFAGGSSLTWMSPDDRAKVEVKGTVLRPQ